MHDACFLFIIKWPAIYLKGPRTHSGLAGLRCKRLLTVGQGHCPPGFCLLYTTILSTPYFPCTTGYHIHNLFQCALFLSCQLTFINSQRKVTVKCRQPFQSYCCRVKIDHEPFRLSPGRQCGLDCGRLSALAASPVIHKEYSLPDNTEQWCGETGRQYKTEFITAAVRCHLRHPALHASVHSIGGHQPFLCRIHIKHDAASMPRKEPLSRLPSECRRGIRLLNDIDVLRLKRGKKLDHILCILRCHSTSKVCQGRDSLTGEYGGPWVYGSVPCTIPFEGHLNLLLRPLYAF